MKYIEHKIIDILGNYKVENIVKPETIISTLNIDSLNTLDFINDIEKTFLIDLDIKPKKLNKLKISELTEIIKQKVIVTDKYLKIKDKINEILIDQLCCNCDDTLNFDLTLYELGLDSLDIIDFSISLEKEFDIKYDNIDNIEKLTVNEILSCIYNNIVIYNKEEIENIVISGLKDISSRRPIDINTKIEDLDLDEFDEIDFELFIESKLNLPALDDKSIFLDVKTVKDLLDKITNLSYTI